MDASAGTGLLAEGLLTIYGGLSRLVLNDPAEKMLQQAKVRLEGFKNVEFTNCFCEELSFQENSFDKICCLNSFHYYTDQKLILAHFHTFLKPGGTLYILDWNRTGTFRFFNKLISLISPEHINTRTKEETLQLLGSRGFTPICQFSWGFRWWKFYFISAQNQK